jgi:hypothetical protein
MGFRFIAGAVSLAAFSIVSCADSQRTVASEKQELFTIQYGSFEDEITLLMSDENSVDTHIAMRDGFFYISNSAQKKIMQFNSYGDLLSVYYNPDANPAPAFASDDPAASRREITMQKASPYPFESPGAVAVDSQKNVYVVDTLPPDRIERDAEHNLRLSQVVLRFSDSGEFTDYLGQRGPGGAPFPWIQNIWTTRDNELAVVCRTNTGMNVYWFSSTGFLRYLIPIEESALPNPFQDSPEVFVSLEKIVPDNSRRVVYLKIDYYAPSIDAAAKTISGIDYRGTYIYPMDITSGSFLDPVAVPAFEQADSKNLPKTGGNVVYDFLGQTDSGWFFFFIPDETGFSIQMIHSREQTVLKRHLDVSMPDVLYYAFSLADNGILSALLADNEKVSVVWWRTAP